MKDIVCLAIESSCDETSMSIIKNGTEEIATVVLPPIAAKFSVPSTSLNAQRKVLLAFFKTKGSENGFFEEA